MLYSQLFPKCLKQAPKDAESANAKFLTQGGFVHQEMAGVYTWLPLGLRVLRNVERIIREEMEALGAQELLMPALQPKENWQATKRWEGFEVLYKLQSKIGGEIALGPTHEEIITPLAGAYVKSYNDLPLALFQIQNKYRDELRAKSGVLRGREFGMKDLYGFHKDEEDLENYYEKVAASYAKIFKRLGVDAVRARATGGAFSKFSDEFQVITPSGEDTIYYCQKCKIHYNEELVKGGKCTEGHKLEKGEKAIEVGNIFKLKTKFSEAFGLKFLDKDGKEKPIIMGCYGLGTTRLVGAIVEANHDEKGIIWPAEVAPFTSHLVALFGKDEKMNKKINSACVLFLRKQESQGIKVLFDDRADVSAGEKFAVADLLGIPERIIISEKTLTKDEMETKNRQTGKMAMKKL
ncbi:MAG: aminoacyl--tRNA ligase-related protein [bacterium]